MSLAILQKTKSGEYMQRNGSSKSINTQNTDNKINNLFFTEIQSQAPVFNRNSNLDQMDSMPKRKIKHAKSKTMMAQPDVQQVTSNKVRFHKAESVSSYCALDSQSKKTKQQNNAARQWNQSREETDKQPIQLPKRNDVPLTEQLQKDIKIMN